MEAANCRSRDIQLVRQTLKEHRPGSIDIDLSQEQFDRVRARVARTVRALRGSDWVTVRLTTSGPQSNASDLAAYLVKTRWC